MGTGVAVFEGREVGVEIGIKVAVGSGTAVLGTGVIVALIAVGEATRAAGVATLPEPHARPNTIKSIVLDRKVMWRKLPRVMERVIVGE